MLKTDEYSANRFNWQRLLLHIGFWIAMWFFTSFVYGYEKQNALMALQNNLLLLPVHMLYFYTLAYVIIPKYLLTYKYFQFFIALLAIMLIMPAITRISDIFLVEPQLSAFLKSQGYYYWEKVRGTKWQRFTNMTYYLNALKGTNLIVWFAIAIKFFKFWYNRHHAALQAELSLLKAQIHPHFLFNTLNNLYALTLNQSPKSSDMVMGLSEMLRYMLYEGNAESVALQKDVVILDHFILLETMRYEDRLELNFMKEIDNDDYKIAPLLLLPLVENAFKYGVGEQIDEAWINIELIAKNDFLKFKISNSKTVQTESREERKPIGLANVKKRLQLLYPHGHQLNIFDEEDVFAVILHVDLSKRIAI